MYKEAVLRHFGSVKDAASALGIWVQTIYLWGDIIPKSAAYRVEAITKGELRVNLSLYKK